MHKREEKKRRIMAFSRGIILLLSTVLMVSCQKTEMQVTESNFSELDTVPQDQWDALSRKKIFFGHKSVGVNII